MALIVHIVTFYEYQIPTFMQCHLCLPLVQAPWDPAEGHSARLNEVTLPTTNSSMLSMSYWMGGTGRTENRVVPLHLVVGLQMSPGGSSPISVELRATLNVRIHPQDAKFMSIVAFKYAEELYTGLPPEAKALCKGLMVVADAISNGAAGGLVKSVV